MVIAFCGHSSYVSNEADRKRVLSVLEEKTVGKPCDFWLGEYGGFDRFAYDCAKEFKRTHQNARLIFITPYHPSVLSAERIAFLKERFDDILYPTLEGVPRRFALSHRNRWIADRADLIIACVSHRYGGAYTMYRRAVGSGRVVLNIASELSK